jgi:hypothetical protein
MSGQGDAAAERSAHVTRGETPGVSRSPVVETAPGVFQLRAIVERDAEIARLQAEVWHAGYEAAKAQAVSWHTARIVALNVYDAKENEHPAAGSGARKVVNAICRNAHLNAADAIARMQPEAPPVVQPPPEPVFVVQRLKGGAFFVEEDGGAYVWGRRRDARRMTQAVADRWLPVLERHFGSCVLVAVMPDNKR